jgi:hypothetical protein
LPFGHSSEITTTLTSHGSTLREFVWLCSFHSSMSSPGKQNFCHILFPSIQSNCPSRDPELGVDQTCDLSPHLWHTYRLDEGADLLNILVGPMASLFHGQSEPKPHPSKDPVTGSFNGQPVFGCGDGAQVVVPCFSLHSLADCHF